MNRLIVLSFIYSLSSFVLSAQDIELKISDWERDGFHTMRCYSKIERLDGQGKKYEQEVAASTQLNRDIQRIEAYQGTVFIGTYKLRRLAQCTNGEYTYDLELDRIRTSSGYVDSRAFRSNPAKGGYASFEEMIKTDARNHFQAGEKKPLTPDEIAENKRKAEIQAQLDALRYDEKGNLIPDTVYRNKYKVKESILKPEDVVDRWWYGFYFDSNGTFKESKKPAGEWTYSASSKKFTLTYYPVTQEGVVTKKVVYRSDFSFHEFGLGTIEGYHSWYGSYDFPMTMDAIVKPYKTNVINEKWNIFIRTDRGMYVYRVAVNTSNGVITGSTYDVSTPDRDYMGKKSVGISLGGAINVVTKGSGGQCTVSDIAGTIKDGLINMRFTFKGSCCKGMTFSIDGKMVDDDTFFGDFIFEAPGKQKNCHFNREKSIYDSLGRRKIPDPRVSGFKIVPQ